MGGTIEIAENDPCGAIVSLVFPATRWMPSDADEAGDTPSRPA
jgi:hypothetical protein